MPFDAAAWRDHWALRLRRCWSDSLLLCRRTAQEFLDDHCTQLAAAIAYYVLFSIFPLAILLVSISGLILTDDRLRADVVEEIFRSLPLTEGEGRDSLQSAVDGIAGGLSAIGLISVVGLAWSATAMMGAIRHALNTAWDTSYRRPFLRAKLVDATLVLGVGLLIGVSIGATLFLQVARVVSDDVSDALEPLGAGAHVLFDVVALLVPLLISFVIYAALYKYVPSVRTRFRDVWPGALLAAVLFELLKNGFAVYLRYFGNYDAIYGSLGAVIIFLFFVYLSALALLIGAELAAEWPRVRRGDYAAEEARRRAAPRAPWRRLGVVLLRGLVSSAPASPADPDAGAGDSADPPADA
jgi:membrane protein